MFKKLLGQVNQNVLTDNLINFVQTVTIIQISFKNVAFGCHITINSSAPCLTTERLSEKGQ